jgi:hypothetical protein
MQLDIYKHHPKPDCSCVHPKITAISFYRLVFHPLAKYPGPLIAALTDWYVVYWIAEGGRHLELHNQHKKHGKEEG